MKEWRAVVSWGPSGAWVQNGFASKEAAEKAAKVKCSVIRRKRKDATWRTEPQG